MTTTTNEAKTCAHPSCQCTVPSDKKYCSQMCEDAGSEELEISCDCGHPGCALA